MTRTMALDGKTGQPVFPQPDDASRDGCEATQCREQRGDSLFYQLTWYWCDE